MDSIKTELTDGKLLITINREAWMNSLDKKTLDAFDKTLSEALASELVKGIIITGAGRKAFVAGADIKEFVGFTPDMAYEMSKNGQRILETMENAAKPILAAVNGAALGGGCELAMACHLRIAVDHAVFGQPEINLGFIPGFGGTQRLTRLLGKTKALELMLTGARLSALEAERMGLINYVCKEEQLLHKAQALMDQIICKPKTAIAGVIASVNAVAVAADGYETERRQFENCFRAGDFEEGIAAFLEKRKANFG